jgi:YD repeat-containing protein
MNRRNSRTDALGKGESYLYDGNSNLTKYTDRNGHYVNYTYDGINRRTIANFEASADVIDYTWDGGDRLTKATDSVAGAITRGYDNLDHLTSEITPQGNVSYLVDNGDRRETMGFGENMLSYSFDNANRLTGITYGGSNNLGRRSVLNEQPPDAHARQIAIPGSLSHSNSARPPTALCSTCSLNPAALDLIKRDFI